MNVTARPRFAELLAAARAAGQGVSAFDVVSLEHAEVAGADRPTDR